MPETKETECENDFSEHVFRHGDIKPSEEQDKGSFINGTSPSTRSNILLIPKSSIRVIYGDFARLPKKVRHFVEEYARLCKPETIHICDGSDRENDLLLYVLQRDGILKRVPKYENCWLAKTDPADVARVERQTYISTTMQRDTVPTPKNAARCQLGNWMAPDDMEQELNMRFPNCMRGRTMFVIPFSMGPVGSPLSKVGIQLTDSAYVVVSMRIMTRIGDSVLTALDNGTFVKCLHSVGRPLPITVKLNNNWPCDPKMLLVAHLPEKNEICSFGSSYGGNALLGKKCFALRLGSIMGYREGWLAEHMLILGIENTKTQDKRYIVAAFPSACGKTNLAMMKPTLPHIKVTCVGDDICWMRFDDKGQLRAINPENGFFGVAPGTSNKTNYYAMETIRKNTIFTNVAETSDGGVFWEGLEEELPEGVKIKSWMGDDDWSSDSRDKPAAHPNSRFCCPASQCPIMDPAWQDPEGVPIDAIIFGGRRPMGVPLVYESFGWEHGVFVGASMRSESTAAAEHKAKMLMHDPFAMRPFFGYNFGDYLQHWLSFAENPKNKLPKIFHVNWFRKDRSGKFLWPGFGENCRVLDWVMRRLKSENIADRTPVGFVPKPGSLDLTGLDKSTIDLESLLSTPTEFWENEVNAIYKYFDEQVNDDLPWPIMKQLKELENRVLGNN